MKELLKHKKLIITLSVILGVVLLVIILAYTLFALRTVDVDFKNNTLIFTDESKTAICETVNNKKGSPILFINKNKLVDELEKDKPYLEVINIETVFPNKLIIHCAEREETYAVKAGEKKYFICDRDFKVLTIRPNFSSSQDSSILFLGLENIISNTNRVNEGEFLKFTSEEKMLKSIGEAMLYNNKTVSDQRALIKSIELDSAINSFTYKNQPYLRFTDYNDFVTEIFIPENLLANKIQIMFTSLSQIIYNKDKFFTKQELENMGELSETYYLNYTLMIQDNTKNEIICRLKPNK